MFNKLKNNKFFKIFIVIFVSVLLLYCVYICANTVSAYNIVRANYDAFNYPSTIKVHSGTLTRNEISTIFTCRISAENAYGQRIYDKFIASEDSIASFDWYDEYGINIAIFSDEKAMKSNVFVPLLNFLIHNDWR